MTNILHLKSSPMGDRSVSNRVSGHLVERLAASGGGAAVTVRDLAMQPIGHVTADFATAGLTPPDQQTAAQKQALAESDALIAELLRADIIVIASPMHNLGPPSVLKAWIDRIVRGGVTVLFGPEGPKGAATGKRCVLVVSAGAVYTKPPLRDMEHNMSYLRHILSLVGITDVNTILVEGAVGPEAESAIKRALGEARELAAAFA